MGNEGLILYGGALGLVVLGLYGTIVSRHLIRILLSLGLLDSGVNLFLVELGYRPGAAAPILTPGRVFTSMVDPLPQALVLTSIVIGVGVAALGLALVIRVHQDWGTLDTRELARRLAIWTGDESGRTGEDGR